MILDSKQQKAYLLEIISRAHRAPAEVAGFEDVREAVSRAEVLETPPAEPPSKPGED